MLFKALIVASQADGKISDEEEEFYISMARKLVITRDSCNAILKEIKNGDTSYAIEESQVPELIDSLAAVIAADGVITEEEEKLIYEVAAQNNFSKEKTEELIKKHLK